MDLQKEILRLAGDRTKLIDKIIAELEKQVAASQRGLLDRIIADWVDKLDINADGQVANTLKNKRALASIDSIFDKYALSDGLKIAASVADGVQQILAFSGKYFTVLSSKTQVAEIMPVVKEFINSWLGLKGNGALEGNGYLYKLVNNTQARDALKNFAVRSVISQQGFQDMKKNLNQMIQGDKQNLGLLERYSRNFVYDTMSQVDRATNQIYADKLDLNYAIYEGGIIKTTRPFCRKRNGKVFTREEIAEMMPDSGIPPNYDPFTDMGGYGCHHHWNWIPYALAVILRPDLRKEEAA